MQGMSLLNCVLLTSDVGITVSDPAVDPGGRIEPPILSETPLLDLRFQPRYTPYLAADTDGTFIIDTSVSFPVSMEVLQGNPTTGSSPVSSVIKNPWPAVYCKQRSDVSITFFILKARNWH